MTKQQFIDKLSVFPPDAELEVIRASSVNTFTLKCASLRETKDRISLTGEAVFLADRNVIYMRGW
jgi:hypothetical protein